MSILWLGPLHSDHAIICRGGANPAAAKWTRGLIGGLKSNGIDVIGLTHCYERTWPHGQIWPGSASDFDPSLKMNVVNYPNLPCLRERYLCHAYARQVELVIKRSRIEALLCYNTLHSYHVAAMRVAARLGVPCFPIILDADDPRDDQWRAILRETRHASGVVFLSYWAAKNYPGKAPVLNMDGGASCWYGDVAAEGADPNLIAYTGGLDHYRGGTFLAEVIRHLPNSNWRILLCGKADRTQMIRLFGHDGRVLFKGFISDKELHDICFRANVFISMRPHGVRENIMNFPSKIPQYLSYGKPVVSTWIDSYDPGYRKFLAVMPDDNPREFATGIETLMAWNVQERARYRDRLRGWFTENKLWSIQAARLMTWIKDMSNA